MNGWNECQLKGFLCKVFTGASADQIFLLADFKHSSANVARSILLASELATPFCVISWRPLRKRNNKKLSVRAAAVSLAAEASLSAHGFLFPLWLGHCGHLHRTRTHNMSDVLYCLNISSVHSYHRFQLLASPSFSPGWVRTNVCCVKHS